MIQNEIVITCPVQSASETSARELAQLDGGDAGVMRREDEQHPQQRDEHADARVERRLNRLIACNGVNLAGP